MALKVPILGDMVWVKYSELSCYWPCVFEKFHDEKPDQVRGLEAFLRRFAPSPPPRFAGLRARAAAVGSVSGKVTVTQMIVSDDSISSKVTKTGSGTGLPWIHARPPEL